MLLHVSNFGAWKTGPGFFSISLLTIKYFTALAYYNVLHLYSTLYILFFVCFVFFQALGTSISILVIMIAAA